MLKFIKIKGFYENKLKLLNKKGELNSKLKNQKEF